MKFRKFFKNFTVCASITSSFLLSSCCCAYFDDPLPHEKAYFNEDYTIVNYGSQYKYEKKRENVKVIYENIYDLSYTDIEHETKYGTLYQSQDIVISSYDELIKFIQKQILVYNTQQNFSSESKNKNILDYSAEKNTDILYQKINWNYIFTNQNNIRLLNFLIWRYDKNFFQENNLILTTFSFDKKFKINKYKNDFYRNFNEQSHYNLNSNHIDVSLYVDNVFRNLYEYYHIYHDLQLKDVINGFSSLTEVKKGIVIRKYDI
ncbi:hypothetical protein EI74_0394 [Mycoplasma testudineum]|uniref:Lipoprotein n=1 Tax=Mycoplasma testudineum TaxID=244584 RepID=A0A4R6IFT4_9MOLU|nr:hypothetical protein [Mycoplasma testudineum]OYD27010.1 hypothetical protein CG473_01595 [Mycoplasma testudineum]TDO20558.1 hypothetical protein EI74_0394 [Mycoplasma testudineum]